MNIYIYPYTLILTYIRTFESISFLFLSCSLSLFGFVHYSFFLPSTLIAQMVIGVWFFQPLFLFFKRYVNHPNGDWHSVFLLHFSFLRSITQMVVAGGAFFRPSQSPRWRLAGCCFFSFSFSLILFFLLSLSQSPRWRLVVTIFFFYILPL